MSTDPRAERFDLDDAVRGAGRVICLVDPIGDVYACPFAIQDAFRAGTVRGEGGLGRVWHESELFGDLRRPQTGGACTACSAYDAYRGGCMAAKFFTRLPLNGPDPDPECGRGQGESAPAAVAPGGAPRPARDHSHGPDARRRVPVSIGRRPPERACEDSPLAGSTTAVR